MFCVDGWRKYILSGMHLSTSWKISARKVSSLRRATQGDFQVSSFSLSGSTADSISSGCSIARRKWDRRESYAALESVRAFGHAERSSVLNRKKIFQQTDRAVDVMRGSSLEHTTLFNWSSEAIWSSSGQHVLASSRVLIVIISRGSFC